MKFQNGRIKILVNLVPIVLICFFHTYFEIYLGEKLILLTNPLVLSLCFLLLDSKESKISFINRLLVFIVLFAGVYFAFNFNNPSFNKIYFLISVVVAVPYSLVQEFFFPSHKEIKEIMK
jgi:hypothetical protein